VKVTLPELGVVLADALEIAVLEPVASARMAKSIKSIFFISFS
jgi:hypothetical protein